MHYDLNQNVVLPCFLQGVVNLDIRNCVKIERIIKEQMETSKSVCLSFVIVVQFAK